MKLIFETPRLFLRQFTLADSGLVLQLNSDPEVLQFLHEPLLENTEQAEHVLENIIFPPYDAGLGRWAIIKKSDHSFIGWCGIKYNTALNEYDLGFRLFKTEWNHGYATEAAAHTLAYGFNQLQLKTITGHAQIENLASCRVMEKIGMRFISEGLVDGCKVKTYIAHAPQT